MRRWVFGAALLAAGACTMKSQEAPPLVGPSGFATDVVVSASPDVLAQDGASQAIVTIVARDAQGGPARSLQLRVDTYVGAVMVDYGILSARQVTTNAEGRATLSYTAPAAPPGGVNATTDVRVVATPVGTNAVNQQGQGATVRLVPPGIIGPPVSGITADFTVTPANPTETQTVAFDATASQAQGATIVNYHWNFGDGRQATGRLTGHAYSQAGSYTVTLTVSDNIGRVATLSKPVTVSQIAAPTVGQIVVSPTGPRVSTQVTFNATNVTAGPGRTIVGYAWDFGDGSTQSTNGPTASHAYAAAGTYTVVLRVTDDLGKVGSASVAVNVQP